MGKTGHNHPGRSSRVCTRKAGELCSGSRAGRLGGGLTWGCRVRLSEGDSMPSRPGAPSQRKIVSAFEHTGFQASNVIIKPAAEEIGLGRRSKLGRWRCMDGIESHGKR